MTVHSLFPAFVKINYHSAFGAHAQILSVREWNPVPLVPLNDLGSFTNWLGLPVDGEEMIDEYVLKLKEFYLASTVIDTATIYTMDTETSPAIPRASMALGVPGVEVSTNWSKAVQHQYILRDTAYNMAKLILLDAPIGTSWDPVTTLTGSAEAAALVGVLTSSAWAFSSKANLQITTFQKITYKLNDKLRKEYNMD